MLLNSRLVITLVLVALLILVLTVNPARMEMRTTATKDQLSPIMAIRNLEESEDQRI